MEQTNEFFLQTSLLLPQVHFYIATSWKVGNRQGRKLAPHFEYSCSLCKFKASHVHMIKGLRTHEHSVCMSAVEGGRGWAEDKGWCLLIWWDFTQSCSCTEVNVRPNCREDWGTESLAMNKMLLNLPVYIMNPEWHLPHWYSFSLTFHIATVALRRLLFN